MNPRKDTVIDVIFWCENQVEVQVDENLKEVYM